MYQLLLLMLLFYQHLFITDKIVFSKDLIENAVEIDSITFTLNNGTKIPQFGMGVYMVPEGEEIKRAVLNALRTAFSQSRHAPI